MKRVLIIVEGDTEKEFVDEVLSPYLMSRGVYNIQCFKIKKTKGGLIKYQHLKKDLIKTVYESNVLVTTMIDFYALPDDFPGYEKAKRIANKSERLSFLEKSIVEDLETTQNTTFANLMPYIQLHEFESLVFVSLDAIKALYSETEAKFDELAKIIKQYPNPEDINDGLQTAPSKRLENNQLIKGYNKVIDGNLIIIETGIDAILEKCPRFRKWVDTIIEKANL